MEDEVLFTVEEVEMIQTFIASLRATADTLEAMTPAEKKRFVTSIKSNPAMVSILEALKEKAAYNDNTDGE